MIQKGVFICHPDTEDPDLAGRAHPGVGAQVLADNAHPCAVDRDLADPGAQCTAGLVLDVQAWGRLLPLPQEGLAADGACRSAALAVHCLCC